MRKPPFSWGVGGYGIRPYNGGAWYQCRRGDAHIGRPLGLSRPVTPLTLRLFFFHPAISP